MKNVANCASIKKTNVGTLLSVSLLAVYVYLIDYQYLFELEGGDSRGSIEG